jgi:hypothetical protein
MDGASLTQRFTAPARWTILFLSGAVGGTLGDFCHVASRTDTYPLTSGPQLPGLGIPYWVPVLFGSAGLAIGLSHPWLDSRIGRPTRPRPGLRSPAWVGIGLAWLLVTWAASGFLPLATGGAKDGAIAAIAGLGWWVLDRTWAGLGLAVATAVLGTGAEILLVHLGIFAYLAPHTNLQGVPSWLPYVYVIASVGAGNLGRWLERGPNA